MCHGYTIVSHVLNTTVVLSTNLKLQCVPRTCTVRKLVQDTLEDNQDGGKCFVYSGITAEGQDINVPSSEDPGFVKYCSEEHSIFCNFAEIAIGSFRSFKFHLLPVTSHL